MKALTVQKHLIDRFRLSCPGTVDLHLRDILVFSQAFREIR